MNEDKTYSQELKTLLAEREREEFQHCPASMGRNN
jgi:hypothetical protein